MPKSSMTPKHIWLWIAGAAVILGVGLGGWWWMRAAAPPQVDTEIAAIGPVTRVLAVNGKIAAQDTVQVRATVSGIILALAVAEGDVIAKGAVMAQIDDSQQAASVAQARAALEQGQTKSAQAGAVYARYLELGAVISRATLDEAARNAEAARQEVLRLRAALQQATIQLARYQLVAPIGGTVILRNVQLGQLADTAAPLFTLADLSVLTVETTVDEAYAAQIAVGQAAQLQLVGSRAVLDGVVTFASPRIDAQTGGRAVTIGFDAPLAAPVGMTVTANVIVDRRDAITVPRGALIGDAVFLLRDGRAVLTPVTVIDWPAARLIVTAGVVAGDHVIIDSAAITDGMKVGEN